MISRGAKSCSRTTACSNGRTPTGRWLRGRMLFIDLHGRLTSIRPGVGKAKGRRYERYSLAARQGHLPQLRQGQHFRSEEHTSELQSLMRISYAVFCLKKKKTNKATKTNK